MTTLYSTTLLIDLTSLPPITNHYWRNFTHSTLHITMATELPTTNGHGAQDGENNFAVKAGLARMLKGGVIMDVVNAEQVGLSNTDM